MISVTTNCADGARTVLKEIGSARKNPLDGAAIVSLPVKLLLASLRSSLTGRTEAGGGGASALPDCRVGLNLNG